MLDELLEVEEGLTNWELDFLESVNQQRYEHGLTERQCKKIEEIHDRIFA